ncbi:hypothetical protein [Microbaculum marinum]|uniref:SGNH/GDSL hydrolase family protein n=1 Tax=Microbaculum marinum TaxID=1764581 RepID=A0AAW9RLK6_9HYPH
MARPEIAGIFLGLLLSVALLEIARDTILFRLEDAALGTETVSIFGTAPEGRVHCQDARDGHLCEEAYLRDPGPGVLWLGNSQLHAINRYRPGDRLATEILHDWFRSCGAYLVAYSQPNANLLEHAIAFHALADTYDVRLLILPVVLDDFREQGVRQSVSALLGDAALPLRGSSFGPFLDENRDATTDRSDSKEETLQALTEAWLDREVATYWPAWAARDQLRGVASYALYLLRNRIFGINAQTQRVVAENAYREKLAVLESLLRDARAMGVDVFLYIPPYRADIAGPYHPEQYARLKADAARLASEYEAQFAQLDTVVAGPEWGMVRDSVFGFEDYDFMHFTAEGQRRLAEALEMALANSDHGCFSTH